MELLTRRVTRLRTWFAVTTPYRSLLSAVLVSIAVLTAGADARASVRTCPAFTIHGNGITLRATHVRRTSRITCAKARKLLAGAYGKGAIKTVYPKSSGRPTYWLAGGWRCGNGAGGAACRNVRTGGYNEVEGDFAVTADTV